MAKQNKPITQNDVAKAAGVTRSMVSYVINNSSDRAVAPETRQRILKAIDTLGYRPNKAAQALQQGNEYFAKNQIGLILNGADVFVRPYYAEIISGIYLAAHKNNYHLHFIRFFNELKDPVLFNKLIHPEEIGSLIMVSTDQIIKTQEDHNIIDKIKSRISKIVCVEWKYEGLSSVLFDRQDTAKRATKHLLSKGYKEISYIGENDDRVIGVQSAFIEMGLPSALLKFIIPAFNMEGGANAIKHFLENDTLTRAIVCGSDEVAIGALCELNKARIEVPKRVAIISIDNIESSAFCTPPLTTMNVQKAAMGEYAVEMIVNNSATQDEKAVCLSLPTSIVERLSC